MGCGARCFDFNDEARRRLSRGPRCWWRAPNAREQGRSRSRRRWRHKQRCMPLNPSTWSPIPSLSCTFLSERRLDKMRHICRARCVLRLTVVCGVNINYAYLHVLHLHHSTFDILRINDKRFRSHRLLLFVHIPGYSTMHMHKYH